MRSGVILGVVLLSWLCVSSASAEEVLIRRINPDLSPGDIVAVDIPLTKTVKDLKALLAKQRELPFDRIRLVFKATQLDDSKTLADCGVVEDSTISLVVRVGR